MKTGAVILLVGLVGCTTEVTPTQPTFSQSDSSEPPSSQPVIITPTPSAATYTVTGTVTNAATGAPLANAAVEWAGLAEVWGDRGHGVMTGSDGKYLIQISNLGGPGSTTGTISMRATKAGYQDQSLLVRLPDGVSINFALPQTR